MPCRCAWTATLVLLALGVASAAGASREDERLAGYATAVIERDLGLTVVSIEVRDGVAQVVVEALGDRPAEQVAEAVAQIEGIERAEVSEATSEEEPAAAPEATAEDESPAPDERGGVEVFPRVELFGPLLADPRQPQFSLSYLRYLGDPELGNVIGTNFGETFALLGGPAGDGRWEFGVLGGVFSVFDLDSQSFDLVNTDFWGGLTVSGRRQWLSGQVRLYHQSSHLGDEFLLRGNTNRVNLSYEGLNLLLSADVRPWLRIYLGGGGIFHSEPNLDPWSIQAGVELESPIAYLGGYFRPIASFDYQSSEERHWHEDIATSAGVQIENPKVSWMKVQLTVDFFTGGSPNGQFFERHIRYVGLGAHLHF